MTRRICIWIADAATSWASSTTSEFQEPLKRDSRLPPGQGILLTGGFSFLHRSREMQRKTIAFVSTLAALAAGPAFAADPKIVTFFLETCGTCHGEKGEGMKGLAPAFKGNDF